MNLISLVTNTRVSCTGLHSSKLSFLHQLCFHPSWIPLIPLLSFIQQIFSHATQLPVSLLSFAVQPGTSLPLFLILILSAYISTATDTDLLASSPPAIITFLHIIAKCFTDQSEKAFANTNFALRN